MRLISSSTLRLAASSVLALTLLAAAGCGSGTESAGDGDAETVIDTDEGSDEGAVDAGQQSGQSEQSDGSDAGTDGADASGADESDADEGGEDESGGDADRSGTDGDALDELFPDVLDATASPSGDGSWTFSATLSSPYDTAERYADAWRVKGPDGEVYGIRELAHDHASEQPFTRSQSGIVIPDDVATVIVEGRDQISGWGGATVKVELPR